MDALLSQDTTLMERALTLSLKARLIAPPNPWVGCVIANHGKIIGEGFTQAPGGAHAEVHALRSAHNQARGATAYVTLEPCCHFGRTPPCVNALIEAGISRVAIGIQDPDVNVSGRGIEKLRKAGIEVTEGVLSGPISASLAPYLYHRRTGLPYCVLKAAVSIDGRLAAQDGTSQWISSPEARADSHQLRAESQAILIGSRTATVDSPALTVRNVIQYPLVAPLRVVLDSQGRLAPGGPLFDLSLAPTLIITTPYCPQKTKDIWQAHGIQIETLPKAVNGVGVDLEQVLKLLGKRGILQVLIEGGSKVHSAFIESKLVNQFRIYIGNCILGSLGIPLFASTSITTFKQSLELIFLGAKVLGSSVRLDYIKTI